jgi:hypothetical protein
MAVPRVTIRSIIVVKNCRQVCKKEKSAKGFDETHHSEAEGMPKKV